MSNSEIPTVKIHYQEYTEDGPLSMGTLEQMSTPELHTIANRAADEIACLLVELRGIEERVEHARSLLRQSKETVRMRVVK